MRAKLSFSEAEIDDLIREKAARGGFVITSDVTREGDELFVEVRPMTVEEKADHELTTQPVEIRILDQLKTLIDDALKAILLEHENTRDFTDNSIMVWLEPFRTTVGRIEEAVQNIERPPKQPRNPKIHPQRSSRREADEDEFAETRRQRFERLRQEQEEEAREVERGLLKGESTEFPEDMRIT